MAHTSKADWADWMTTAQLALEDLGIYLDELTNKQHSKTYHFLVKCYNANLDAKRAAIAAAH